jgi:predicted cupin superfamily sugar epimerase
MPKVKYWIEKLALKKHPEGGFYKEAYRSDEQISVRCLPVRYSGSRDFSTSIYFLLEGSDFSGFHKIQSDETWHFYEGTPLDLYVISGDGTLQILRLGRDADKGESLQITIPANCWFGARVVEVDGYSLTGCTVAPGFHFDDFELAIRADMAAQFPQHTDIIAALTRQ